VLHQGLFDLDRIDVEAAADESGALAVTPQARRRQSIAHISLAIPWSSVWLVHPTCVPQLYTMSYITKNVAGDNNVCRAPRRRPSRKMHRAGSESSEGWCI
jgi:hypothetical protein